MRNAVAEITEPQFLTVKDLAKRFDKNDFTVRSWIDNGWLKSRRFGGRIRVHSDEANRMKQILDAGLPPSAARLKSFQVLPN